VQEELRELIKSDLRRQEGVEYKAYRCSLGHLTIGIGHKITDNDPKSFYSERITNEEVDRLLEEDLDEAIEDADSFCKGELGELPPTVQRVIVNMHFQMGYGRMSGFSRMRQAVFRWDWRAMIAEMKDSLWYKQTPNRAKEEIGWVKEMLNGSTTS
jgi:lysozyme